MEVAKPIRVVFCITELDPGGAERALTQLILNLDRIEWEPYVVCLGPRGHFADVLEAAQLPVSCLNAGGLLSLPRVLIRLVLEFRRLRPALVQTYLFHANILGRIAAQFAGRPIVVSGIRVAEHRSGWYGRIDRWTNFLVDLNVCVSRGVAEFSEKQVGINSAKLVVIPNGVEIERFSKAQPADLTQFGIPVQSRVLISIGRLEHQKGIDVLLDAIALIEALPDDVHFLIVGDGPDSASLHDQAEEHKLSDRVHFVGRRDDVTSLLAASTALIISSRWEGMPNVVLEAMAAAKPVIATQVEGVAELVRNGETGLVVPKENPCELAKAIQYLIDHSEFANTAGICSQHIVEKQFTTKSVAGSYANLYRRLLRIS